MEKQRKVRTGTIVSNKMNKTVVVMVVTLRRHPLYKKVVKHTSKFKVHDETNACRVGDLVKIAETRPLSKEKCWRIVEIIKRKEIAEAEPAEIT